MRIEEVIRKLKEKNFNVYEFEMLANELEEANIQSWSDGKRILMLKEYRTESAFLEWLKCDQPIIGEVYTYLESIYKNNLYFLIALNFKVDSLGVRLEINRAEKNDYVCKKHVLVNSKDLEKIPFLNDKIEKVDSFNFDEKFKTSMIKLNENKEILKKNNGMDNLNVNIEKILNYYFNGYLENNKIMDNDVLNILEIGDKNVYK
ncbi:hypothetical protein CO726_28265 [Bacillus fungorum]|uniref:Uncharacterized protein n=1 Tax=Bacillus fungorum TaxID=2039284 RepID=A0A2G6Q5K2_9BACI|nr:ABC-three component system middle component 1 [Bacillus fungorum]PIE92118.1 hypothetical protein CO726_28265 [Bacillus fungorum]